MAMAITRQVITSLQCDGTDMLGTKNIAVKIIDESIVSGSLLTVESNHFCVLKSRGAVLNIYDTGQYALVTPDKPAEKGPVSAPNAAVGAPFQIGGQPPVGFYPVGDETGLSR
jgi:hypothetical protein